MNNLKHILKIDVLCSLNTLAWSLFTYYHLMKVSILCLLMPLLHGSCLSFTPLLRGGGGSRHNIRLGGDREAKLALEVRVEVRMMGKPCLGTTFGYHSVRILSLIVRFFVIPGARLPRTPSLSGTLDASLRPGGGVWGCLGSKLLVGRHRDSNPGPPAWESGV